MIAAPALASPPEATQTLSLAANVKPFCKVSQEFHVVKVTGNAANLGTVTEICNTRGGYRVDVQLTNAIAGTVSSATDVAPILDGSATLVRPSATKLVQNWSVSDLVRRNPAAAVAVRFTISPI
jgi:hypothetical protein